MLVPQEAKYVENVVQAKVGTFEPNVLEKGQGIDKTMDQERGNPSASIQ